LNSSKQDKSVLLFACLVALLIFASAYLTERNGLVDEPGFLNPPYMMAHYGKLTFPTYPHGTFFDVPVVTHPPVHAGWIGLLWRIGLPPYYAEATPTVILFLLAILIIVYSRFPTPVKLGWLFSIGFLGTSGETMTLCFGTRPEGELLAAWFCGLLLLESGRLENWQSWRLFAGALFLTWASATHYYAGPAFLGVSVYVVWVVRSLGWKLAKPRVVAMFAGGCLFGIPYLVLYVLPYFKDIRAAIAGNQGEGGIGLSIQRHMAIYQFWVRELDHPLLIRRAMALGLPLCVLSTALLAAVRSTRGIALASLPLQLGLFLFAWHKMPYYFVHESVLFAAALAVAALALCQSLIARYLPKLGWLLPPVAVAVLCFCLISGSPMLAHADFSLRQRFDDTEVAQAAGRRIMGPHARVGGRWWSWDAAGAEHWYDVEHDLFLKETLLVPATYLSNLDAFEVCYYEPNEQDLLHDWFADGKLKLRGFFFGQSNQHLRCLQLSPRQTSPLVGYAEWDDQLFRFQEEPSGSYAVLSAICPNGHDDWHNPWIGSFSVALRIPDGPSGTPQWLMTALAPQAFTAPAGRIGQGCREISRTRGNLAPDDRRAIVEWARHNDAPIHFYHSLDEMPGYTGVGLPPEASAPPDAVRVENIVNLQGIEAANGARVERSPGIRVTTIPVPGGFSAVIPVHDAGTVKGPCWVVLNLRVREGRVGFGAAAEGGTLLAHSPGIAPSPEPQSVALKVPDFRNVRNLIVFNQSRFAGQADILDAFVVVARP
jgi:hypothetical protein